MTVIYPEDRFACARHGHDPAVRLTVTVFVESWICPCARCGQLVEFKPDPTGQLTH